MNEINGYAVIEFTPGSTIQKCVSELLSHQDAGRKVCGEFNGIMLYSDTVTIDSAYLEITGKTKQEFDEEQENIRRQYEKDKKEHEEKIPELTEYWIKKGHEILDEDKWVYWDKCVPARLKDLYEGMELACCLEIVDRLNRNESFEEVKKVLDYQGHSGMSHSIVCAMVAHFCIKGPKFVDFIRKE